MNTINPYVTELDKEIFRETQIKLSLRCQGHFGDSRKSVELLADTLDSQVVLADWPFALC